MNKALVTGASGFLGTALCAELARRGIEVIAVVRETSDASYVATLPGVRVVRCDMEGYSRLPEMIADRDVDVFFHLAWAGITGKDRGSMMIQLANIRAACEAVEASAKIGCGRFFFASSIHEFEMTAFMRKNDTPSIGNLYSIAKLSANYMARSIAGSKGIEYLRGIISNVYGPGEKSDRLIISTLRTIASGRRMSFSPGDQLYDFIYITDAADAIASIGEKGKNNADYYIGNSKLRPLKEFLMIIGEATSSPDKIGIGELQFSGLSADHREIDLEALHRDTGFVPAVDFSQGIRETYAWISSDNTLYYIGGGGYYIDTSPRRT